MGISPQEFYTMDIEDFILKGNGFLEGRLWLEEKIRRASEIIHRPHVAKTSPSIMALWPMPWDKRNQQKAREHVDQQNLEAMNKHKEGGFEYVLDKGRIVMKKINMN
jgi:hypothetical protein